MLRGKRRLAILLNVVSSLLLVLIDGAYTSAATTCDPMQKYEIIFVRGSGEELNGQTSNAIRQNLEKNIDSKSYDYYELTPELEAAQGLPQYEATPVIGSRDAASTGLMAMVSFSSIGKYRDSLETGKSILSRHLKYGIFDNRCVVLLGYSQGAQVIGEVLSSDISGEMKQKITYVGLFGDPKFDSYGYGVLPGQNIPWYRGDAIVGAQGGILGRRWPGYIPSNPTNAQEMFTNASSWCYTNDPVCASNIAAFSLGTHGQYGLNAIPQAVIEIASVINNPTRTVSKSYYPTATCGATKQDLVVLLDTSPLMRRDGKLYTDTPMYDPYNTSPTGAHLPPRTAGQMLTGVGCGDTRLAVIGYGQPSDGPPKLLLDFTSNPADYDALMKSLYQPNATGEYERTQFREGALKALDLPWRDGASHTIFTMTDIPGSGPSWGNGGTGYWDTIMKNAYKKDDLTQQVIVKARQKNALIFGMLVGNSYTGFMLKPGTTTGDTPSYLNLFADYTGAYNWNKEWIKYGEYNFKFSRLDVTLNEALQRQEKAAIAVTPIKGRVGQSVTTKVIDTIGLLAAAKLRNDGVLYDWYIDCNDVTIQTTTLTSELTFVPTKPGQCTGIVTTSVRAGSGGGCYYGCPEPFPPYIQRVLPVTIDIKPADYIPKVPSTIFNLHKVIYDTAVEYRWDKSAYNGDDNPVYVIRDTDGSVLGVTAEGQLMITDTNRSDPAITIESVGLDGASAGVSSVGIEAQDLRTVDAPVPIDPIIQSPTPIPYEQEPIIGGETDNSADSALLVDKEGSSSALQLSATAQPADGVVSYLTPGDSGNVLGSEVAVPAVSGSVDAVHFSQDHALPQKGDWDAYIYTFTVAFLALTCFVIYKLVIQ